MIIDNENNNLKAHEWIANYTEEGRLDIVTGYFTIGALAWLSNEVNNKIEEFKLVLGDIVNLDSIENRPLDLLNENITIEASLKLNRVSQQAVDFLKQDKVLAKTLEPNFCHAKSYVFSPKIDDDRNKYFITGSSNLTEAGIGLKQTNNIELNIAETGNNNQYKELAKWFDKLWNSPQAHEKKTLVDEHGNKTKINFKLYLIKEIEKIFIKYTPRELYFKILFELFGNQILENENDPEFNRQIGKLENSVIYNTLYEFQKKGALSLIRMLQKYNGAILADAVGLGKTWSALAVIKFFQQQGRETLLICPKKLEHNWRRYKIKQESRFEKDGLDYAIRYHTDLDYDRMNKPEYRKERADTFFTNDKPKLIVLDESHNLRNHKSNRFKFLLNEIIKKNDDIKILLLSATPINNSLNDIRNQFRLMVKGRTDGYYESLSIRNLDYTFRSAQKVYNEWRNEDNPVISDFVKQIPKSFFTLTDALIVARTRKMVEGQHDQLNFPKKNKPVNLFVTPNEIGNYESFEELFEKFPPMLSGYQPSFYVKEEEGEKDVLKDEKQRDRFLVKMMYILMVKRLESSWYSFYSTVEKIRDHHQRALQKIKTYQKGVQNETFDKEDKALFEEDDLINDYEELTLGKKRKVSLKDIDEAGNLDNFKTDLKRDISSLDNLITNLQKFDNKLKREVIAPNNHRSEDTKLEALIAEIKNKRLSPANNSNQKVIIFTVYRDTATYIFEQLKARGFDKLAMVSGSGSLTDDSKEEVKNFETILERFAPYTKLYKEKEWDFRSNKVDHHEAYRDWINWIKEHDQKTQLLIENPIDILIATDSLSEGQNLQDADMVINYDIHWNPVRIIQRMGRIDRLGSPNQTISGINFWPSDNINAYLNLQGRIEQRMATMKLAGAEVDEKFSETFREISKDESLDQRMKDRMMKQMKVTFEDLDGEETFGFDDLSLEKYRQDLLEEFNKDKDKFKNMPKGVYTGFKADTSICPEDGMIALLGYPCKPPKVIDHVYKVFDLIYINTEGKMVLINQKDVLDALAYHNHKYAEKWERFVPEAIDRGEEHAIQKLVKAFKKWLEDQATEEVIQKDGTKKKVMGKEPLDILSKLKRGDKTAISRTKQNKTATDKFQLDNFDLISWHLVTKK